MTKLKNLLKTVLLIGIAINQSLNAQTVSPAQQLPQPLTPYTIGAQRSGISTCIPRVNQVTSFLIGQQQNSGVMLSSPNRDANTSLSSVVMEIQVAANASSYVSATFSPKADGGCGATYEAVSYWNATCTEVANASFSGLKATGPLLRQINMLDGGPTLKVFLMPIGSNTCISIKKELIF
jgi:hypothetical protein